MLVLGRLVGEEIHIDTTADGRIVVALLDARKGRAKFGVKAPENVPVNPYTAAVAALLESLGGTE